MGNPNLCVKLTQHNYLELFHIFSMKSTTVRGWSVVVLLLCCCVVVLLCRCCAVVCDCGDVVAVTVGVLLDVQNGV